MIFKEIEPGVWSSGLSVRRKIDGVWKIIPVTGDIESAIAQLYAKT